MAKTVSFEFVELFAGIGGFHLGLSAIGGKCVFASEWDRHSAATYSEWFPDTPLDTQDIRSLDFDQTIPDHDVLAGGFPCQPFSIAGVSKKNSLNREHGFRDEKQGNLFFSIAEIAALKRPKIVFLENVKNLISHDRGKTWQKIQETFVEIGYSVRHSVVDSSFWVPQKRQRVFIVAFDTEVFSESEIKSFRFPEHEASFLRPVLRDILDTSGFEKEELSDNLWAYLQAYAEKHRRLGNGFGFQIADKDSQSRTLSARYYKDGSEILIEESNLKNPRKISVNEAGRLMGFDTEFAHLASGSKGFEQVVSDVQAYKQYGNAVVPGVVRAIGKEIKRLLRTKD